MTPNASAWTSRNQGARVRQSAPPSSTARPRTLRPWVPSATLLEQIALETDFEAFFGQAPRLHPNVSMITGVICGVRIEEIEDPLMRQIRYLDKLVDELARGRPLEKILRE